MDVFGRHWAGHAQRIADNWRATVADDDLVLVPGDISWAMTFEEALPDLRFIAALPGKKALLRGNHDYWWDRIGRLRAAFPGMTFIQADAARIGPYAVCGTRLWDNPDINWGGRVGPNMTEARPGKEGTKHASSTVEDDAEARKIWKREIERLKLSLRALEKIGTDAKLRIAMTHFPPLDPRLIPTEATSLLTAAGINLCVFGHLHNLDAARIPEFPWRFEGVDYVCASCDLTDFRPAPLTET